MIAKLKGTVTLKDEKSAVLDVAGVGYRVFMTKQALLSLKTETTADLWTHLSVKETALEIYGFREKSDLDFFELLISISGIGPRSALGILNISTAESLRRGILEGDIAYLTKVSGIGKKTAEKIVVELRDKLGVQGENETSVKEDVEVIEALKALGYSTEEARGGLRKISSETQGVAEKIKAVLKILSR